MSSSSSSLLSSRESGGGQGSSSNNNRLKMNFVDVVAAATAAGDGGKNLSDADVSGSGEVRCRRRNGGGVGSEEEESNHGEHDATIINNAGHKKSVIPVPPPMPAPPAFFEIERPIVQSIREFSNNNGTKRTENLNWCKLWPPPEAVKMSSEQAKARHLVLNEIKELQLRRQTSFKRILKLPIWGSGKN